MLVGHDHQVAGGIRKEIQDDEIQSGAIDQVILGVLFFLLDPAEHAVVLVISGGDVLVAPGAPEGFHSYR